MITILADIGFCRHALLTNERGIVVREVAVPDTDLTGYSDEQLDARLQLLFHRHKTGDKQTKHAAHHEATRIIAEQGRRYDGWVDAVLGVG